MTVGVRAAVMHTFSTAADAGIGLLSLEPNELGRKRTEELQTNLYKENRCYTRIA